MKKLKELDLSEFEGLNTYNAGGYITYYIPEHRLANKSGKVYQHMIAAEQMLGRELKQSEVVHHKDRDKHNNSFDNLMVFKTIADHAAYHQGCDVILDDDVYVAIRKQRTNICPLFGNDKYYNAEMCLDCYNKERAKNIPPKEELYELLLCNSMCAIGRIYDVSDNAVRNWCRKYGLPYKYNDLKRLRESIESIDY